jgi:hypothetical protein
MTRLRTVVTIVAFGCAARSRQGLTSFPTERDAESTFISQGQNPLLSTVHGDHSACRV